MVRTLVPTLAVALVLSACSGGGSPEGVEPGAGPADAASASSTGTPSGTAPGTDLAFGETAVLAWQASRDVAGELELTVDAVAEQRQSVFDGWIRDDAMAASRPYFVSVTVSNVGEVDLGGQDVPLYLRDNRDSLGAPWTLGGAFTPCQSGPLPDPFPVGTEVGMCLVYLVPDGGRIRDLVFEPTEGYDPITWTGDVERPAKPKKDKDRRG